MPAIEEPSPAAPTLEDPTSPAADLQRVLGAVDANPLVTMVVYLFVGRIGAAGLVRSLIPGAPVGLAGPLTTHPPPDIEQMPGVAAAGAVEEPLEDRWPPG